MISYHMFKLIPSAMKKAILFLAAITLLISCGNNKQNNKQNNKPEPEQDTFTVETYEVIGDRLYSTRGEGDDTYEERGSFQCEIDIPVTDNQALRDSICYWIASHFGSEYDGDPRDLKALVNHYKDYSLDPGLDDDPVGFDLGYTVKMLEANDRYVTYSFHDFFEESGSPRSNFETTYATFDSKTGKRFTREMIVVDDTLEELVMNALLEQYFSEWDDEDLFDVLYFDPEEPEESGFSLPQFNEPWIKDDYFYFGYGMQEIAQYSAGQPQCSLPYSVMEPYLTEEGKAFF